MINAIISGYVNNVQAHKAIEEQIQEDIQKAKKTIERAEKRIERLQAKQIKVGRNYPSWVDEIVETLAMELANRLHKNFEIYGPFGLRCETSIYLFDCADKGITEQETWSIRITPGRLDLGEIYYDTGEVTKEFGSDTIGYMNGMNNVSKPLPDDIEDIIKLLRHSGADKKII